ncbi:hypothetical protein [Nigerium massiliense]|uniref:hypothetical protein n=1 Tax=Nigerium massiliense TaxID=1522317 RepID=UPI0006950AFB|nr:hypothetical protein [Nigerium massiliense]
MASAETSPAPSSANGVLITLRVFALITAIASIVQAVLGLYLRTAPSFHWHSIVAMIALVTSVVAAVAAFLWSRRSGNKGLFMHAVSVPVIGLIQFALGEMSVTMVHILLGFVFLLDAVALVTLAFRKPGVSRPSATV